MCEENIKILPLGKNYKIAVSKIHTFGTDAVLLSYFCRTHKYDKICEFGTGCGIISLLISKDNFFEKIDALDIQADAIELINKSIELNDLNEKINAINIDLKEYNKNEYYDIVVCNPPYKIMNTGLLNKDKGAQIARHEVMCTIEDITKKASQILKFGGRLYLCHKPERLCDIITAMKNAKIEPKVLTLVQQRNSIDPWLMLIEGKKGGKPGITIGKNLVIENDDGTYSDNIKKYYEDFII